MANPVNTNPFAALWNWVAKQGEQTLRQIVQNGFGFNNTAASASVPKVVPSKITSVAIPISLPSRNPADPATPLDLRTNGLRIDQDNRYLYQFRGAHPSRQETSFEIFAPHALEVVLVLTAYGNEEHRIPLQKNPLGLWQTSTSLAPVCRTYYYCIRNASGEWTRRTDPFSFSVMAKEDGSQSVVSSIKEYFWKDQLWMQKRKQSDPRTHPLSIYELNVEQWKKNEGCILSFRELAPQICNYCKDLGVTHMQLYGVVDHKNAQSWGYQIDHFFAINRRMGKAEDFQYFIDYCHQRDIGVILDWNCVHYKHEHGGDSSESLYYLDGTDHFGTEPSAWGTALFDFNKEETRRFLLANALYWIEVMHVDGLRFDAVEPLLFSREAMRESSASFLKELNSLVSQKYPGVLLIAEETRGFLETTIPVSQGGLGFDSKLGVYQQTRMRHYFKTPYAERSRIEHHNKLVEHLEEMGKEQRWLLAHTHDDAAQGAPHQHSTLYSSIPTFDSWQKFADMRLFHAWNLFTPGVGHLIHMGDEIGQKWAWNHRLNASEGAVEWHLLQSENHATLLNYVQNLHKLYREKPAFWKHSHFGWQMISHHAPNCVLGFYRSDFENQRLALFFNFSYMGYKEYDFPLPLNSRMGEWKEVFNSDEIHYGGTGNFENRFLTILRSYEGAATHLRMVLPPLSVVVFEELN